MSIRPRNLKCESHSRCQVAGNCYIVNATSWLGPLDMVQPIYGYLMPVLMCITFISNSVIIIVLSRFVYYLFIIYTHMLIRPSMKSPTNTVLLSMAVCDLLTIILPAPWLVHLHHQIHFIFFSSIFFQVHLCLQLRWTRLHPLDPFLLLLVWVFPGNNSADLPHCLKLADPCIGSPALHLCLPRSSC